MKCDAKTETEMREYKLPKIIHEEDLISFIHSLVEREHDYGTCCYAMSLAAYAAFMYVAGKLGVTGFQASCADLNFIKRTRHYDGPFMILKGEDMLYPQYDLHAKLTEAMEEWRPWAKERAEKLLAEKRTASPAVINHWKKLAS